jgi:hypothetical protein
MKKMRKNTLMTLIVLLLCSSVLLMTAYAAVQNISSYETLKNALLNYNAYENGTLSVNAKISDNGKELASTHLVNKLEDEYTSSSYTSNYVINGVPETYESWENKEQIISKNHRDNDYMVRPNWKYNNNNFNYYTSYSRNLFGYSSEGWETLTPTQQKFINAVIDLAVGDVKNYFTANGNTISLNLSKNQIPQVAQLLLAVGVEQINIQRENGYIEDDINEVIPMFTADTEIELANMTITINDSKQITGCDMIGVIKGTDIDGLLHELVLELTLSITDIGTTKADTVDLTDKNVFNPDNYYSWDIDENGNRITFDTQDEWNIYWEERYNNSDDELAFDEEI